jgi:nanoRNase/pAp phosphatase (c-di-AMP/oligoRNAs hydrolase)
MFGGGGHPRAAGAKIVGNVQEVKEKLLKELKKVLK